MSYKIIVQQDKKITFPAMRFAEFPTYIAALKNGNGVAGGRVTLLNRKNECDVC